jgi:hypothetical protein
MAIGSVSINDLIITEGNSGTQLATFTVLRSGGTDPFAVSYATADSTATAADGDYIPTSGTLQFATGVNAQTFTVTINGDTKVEPNETFFVNLSGATAGATISKSQGTGTIINDDASGSVAINDLIITEGNSGTQLATFTVTRTGTNATAPFDVSYATADSTATAVDGDYVATSGTLHFGVGVNTQTISITIDGDTKVEPNEAFFVLLSGATNSAVITKNVGTGTIINDDVSGSVAINDLIITEGNSGTQLATFTVTRTGTNATAPFDVSYATADSTATAADGDYVPTSGTLHFGVGVNTQTISITIDGDTKFEPNEAFFVLLSGATNSAVITKNVGTGTIINDDVPPPPAGTTAVMIMSNPSNGTYEVYNVGGNAILAAYQLGQVGAPWTFAALGTLQAGDTSDMLLRNSSTGAFEAYYVSGNNITNKAVVGTVGLDWNFAGIGDFDGASSLSELMLRNASSGSFELYQVVGGGVLSGSSVAPVGNNFQVKGFGDFSGSPETQMIMQDNTNDASAGQLELYTYQPSTASLAGTNVGVVGSNLSIVGCADLLGNGMTQMVMQQNNGNFWLYSYNATTNSLSGILVGAIGSNFHVVGCGPLGTAGRDEMLMQDAAGNFEVYQYNASLNAFVGNSMGAVGAPWVLDGIAANPPTTSMGSSDSSTSQLVQAMAGFGGSGAVESLNTAPLGTDTSQQTLLTTPQHA